MNYYKLSTGTENGSLRQVGPFVARIADPDDIVIRRHSLFSAEMQIRAEWNRYVGTLIANGVKAMFKNFINHFRVARTMAELSALDDRMLADIGLTRDDLASVARKLTLGTTQPVAAKTVISTLGKVTEMPAGIIADAANTDGQRKAA